LDLPENTLAPQIYRVQLCGREQKIRPSIDGYPKVFFRPRMRAIMTAQARLDMRQRNSRQFGPQSSPKGAGRISLDDDEAGVSDRWFEPPRHEARMPVRVHLTCTAKLNRWIIRELKSGEIEVRMLTGQDQPRKDSASCERFSNW
jgi:hypothetical protein